MKMWVVVENDFVLIRWWGLMVLVLELMLSPGRSQKP